MPEPEADYTIDWDDDVQSPPLRTPAPPPARPAASARTAPVRRRRPVAAISPEEDRELAEVAANVVNGTPGPDGEPPREGVVATGDTVELLGEKFRIAEAIGLMPLLKFASASTVEVQDPRALAAMYTLLRDCIYEGAPGCGDCADCQAGNDTACASYDRGDWGKFEEHAMITKADAEDLMKVVQEVLEVVSGRPTPQRAGSSAGARATQRGSTASKSGTRARGSRR